MNNNFKGLVLIVIGMLFFITQDILIKLTIFDVSLLQILVIRATVGCLLLFIYLFYNRQEINFGSSYPFVAIFRGSTFFFGFTMFYISLSKISLAEATSLFFVSPFFITIYSYLILKIKIGLNRVFSIIVGFSGTLLIIKPDFNDLNIYMLLPIITAATYALSMTLAKKTADKDSLFQQTFHIYLGAMLGGSIISLLIYNTNINIELLSILNNPWIINDLQLIGVILLISIVGSLGILSLIAAYRIGSPLINAPAEYVHLIFALILGFFIFDELPDFYSFIGIALIVSSGIHIVFRENRRNNLVVAKTTLRS
tara:strand:- start:152 stop:1087 length:936 start_codon:yes stop_codon:yes gene_type:complete